MDDTILKVAPLFALLFVWAITFVVLRNRRHRTEARRDVQLALLNKFSSGEEMSRFLSTEEGRRLVDQLAEPSGDDPRHRTAGMLVGGCVMTFISIGCWILYAFNARGSFFLIPAVMNGAIGVGVFVGAAVSHWVSKKLGLIPKGR